MNITILEQIRKLNKTQYKVFLRYALGYKCFINKENYRIQINKPKFFKEKSKINNVMAYQVRNSELLNAYTIQDDDYDELKFSDIFGEKYNIANYFDLIDNNVLFMFIYLVRKDMSSKDETFAYMGKQVFEEIFDNETYNFILGAGVNVDYRIGNWDYLINDIRDEISNIKGISKKDLCSFEEKMLNTNYIAPQILKDLNVKDYYYVLENNLYHNFDINDTVELRRLNGTNPKKNIKDTTLYQIARITASQKGNSKVLTFNYDNVFELVLKNNFPNVRSCTVYKKQKSTGKKIEIIHSHGYLPYNYDRVANAKGIILSSYEYMEGYLDKNEYAKRELDNQLFLKNIIVGNSMADYEEQKTFFNHHKDYPSDFSFLLTTKSSYSWMDEYRTKYYWKMGVIPVFFDDFTSMTDYLKTI